MLRLLFVTTSFENGAIPNILGDLAPYLKTTGWFPQVLTLEPLPESSRSVQRWRELGLSIESLDLDPRQTWQALRPLKKALQRLAPDLIHTHLGRADVYVPWVKGKTPQITTFHSVRRNAGRLTQWGWRLSDNKVAHRTGVSQACLDSFYADGFLNSPHSVVYNPVALERLEPKRTRQQVLSALGFDNAVRLLVAVGRLVPVKGHAELVTAFARLYNDDPRLRLVIAGVGPLEATLRSQIERLGLDDQVVLAGEWDGVADLYRAAELVVFPSHWEGLGLVPLEALACGCPVATSKLPAVEEFLVEGVNGRFFESRNLDSLFTTVQAMLADPEGSRAMAQAGSVMVRERFAPAKIAQQYAQLYTNILR